MPLQKLAKWVPAPGSILCFHSLTSPELPSGGSANVPVELFRSIVDVLREDGEIVPLSTLVHRSLHGRSSARLYALTFDDAYASLPSLAGSLFHDVPASIFVATAFAEDGSSFWWDRVDDLHPHIELPRWQAFETALGLPDEYRRGQPPELGPLRPLRQWVLHEFRGRWPSEFEPVLRSLELEAGVSTRHRSMTFQELDEFVRDAPIEIGMHTVTHPVLPLLSDEEIRSEIGRCREVLEGRYRKTVPILAPPFGLYDKRTVDLAREAGMLCSLSVSNQTLAHPPTAGVLPRFVICSGEKPWKLQLRLTGLVERFRPPRYLDEQGFPALPSPSS